MLGYADNIILLGNDEESTRNLIKSIYNMNLVRNENNTKYIAIAINAIVKGIIYVEGLIFKNYHYSQVK